MELVATSSGCSQGGGSMRGGGGMGALEAFAQCR